MSVHVTTVSHAYKNMPWPETRHAAKNHIIGLYGVTETGEVVVDQNIVVGEFARFIHSPAMFARKALNWDLNVGFEFYKDKEIKEDIDRLLDFLILKAKTKEDIKRVLNGADFVCRRYLLRSLIMSPYSKTPWKFDAIKRDGIIYLCEKPTDEDLKRNSDVLLTSYWGHKFEQYITTSEKQGMPDEDEPLSKKELKIFALKRFERKGHPPLSIAFTAEVSALDAEGKLVQLKTFGGGSMNDEKFRKWRCLQWWGQAYITGVDRIIVGHKTEEGIVNKVEEISVASLLKKSFFNPSVSLNFLVTLLDQLKVTMKDGDAYTVHFDINTSRNSAIIRKVEYDKVDFLSDRFLRHFHMSRNPKD